MAITVTREPQAIFPSKNPIIYHLQSDARIDNSGTAAINEIQFAGVIADGTIVAIR
ncbi:hypothetical protein [Dyadobacter bucti]|jgi:hypothetical protein|uniref:hypothetical protein n=1 Tax=Dyadobacter bucti TaxID=2572203 RepID=UPI003F726408